MQRQKQKILFLNLSAFSLTGGIEKFNKNFLKALKEIEKKGSIESKSYSLHDNVVDEKYYTTSKYKTFNGKRLQFVAKSVLNAKNFDTIILGHINLAIIGCLIKKIFPAKKIILITHGIEVWSTLTGYKKTILQKADLILSVSNFTKNKIVQVHSIDTDKIKIFYNTIDPYFSLPKSFSANNNLREKYGISKDDFVLYTLTRLSSSEKYKGYDVVLKCLPGIKKQIPNVKYVIGGKYDKGEKDRLDVIIKENRLEDTVIFLGFIKDDEIQAHYAMSDVFIMPSKGEGFGIVFIEAMVCGLQVIAGNKDGSVDAVQNGTLGTLVDPDNIEEIQQAVFKVYNESQNKSSAFKSGLQQKTLNIFGFDQYKKKLKEILFQY